MQGIGFGGSAEAGARRLAASLAGDQLAAGSGLGWQRGRPPYPGLAAMDVTDAGVFFGRADEVRDLLARVERLLGRGDGDLVLVLGPSGAGKSSLVRAGLVARLAAPGSGWVTARPFEPGLAPLGRLARALADAVPGGSSEAECRERLRGEGLAVFGEWLTGQTRFPARRVLVTVDQAEQLTSVTFPAAREEFAAVLGSGPCPGSPVTVVLTARSDRLGDIQQLPVIGQQVRGPFVVGALPRSRLAEVIEGPARRAGLAFEAGLAGRIADDAARGGGDAAGALPLLAFTLREMYDRLAAAGRDRFTAGDYELTGRIDGAITRRTRQAEEALPAGSGPDLDRLLPRFITLAPDRRPAARPVPRDQLTAAEQAIVGALEDQRLLTGTSDLVRLTHERLITAWPRLAAAVAQRRDDLILQDRLERQAQDWAHGVGGLPGRDATAAATAWLAQRAEPGTSRTIISDYIRAARAGGRVLVVVDQAEQLGTVTSPDGRDEFAAVLNSGLGPGSPVTVVLTARSDRLAEIQQLPVIGPAIRAPFVIGPLPGSRFGEVIEGPARRAGLAFAPGLAARITADAAQGGGDAANALPLLAFALREMYDRLAAADRDCFADEDYDLTGRIDGAIALRTRYAEESLPPGTGPALDRLLPRFVTIAPDRKPAARPVAREQLDPGDQAIVAVLEDQRLVTGTSDHVRLAHEHLIVAWPRLAAVVAEQRDDLILLARLERQALDWKHGVGGLPGREVTAAAASRLAAHPRPERTVVTAYIQAAQHALRRRRGRTATALASIVALAIISSAVAVVALAQRSAAMLQSRIATSEALAAQATSLARTNVPLAMLLSLQAYETAPTPQAGTALTWASGQPLRRILAGGGSVDSLAFSPDGKTLAGSDDTDRISVVLWNMTTGRRTGALTQGFPSLQSSRLSSVAFSADGTTLAGIGTGPIVLWDAATGRRTATMNPVSPGSVSSIAFGPAGTILAVGSDNGQVVLLNTATRHTVTLGRSSRGPDASNVSAVAFSPHRRELATADDTGHVVLWNTVTDRPIRSLGLDFPADDVVFSPDGKTLATSDGAGEVMLWNTATGKHLATVVQGGAPKVNSIAFSPDGTTLAAGDDSGNIVLWNTAGEPGSGAASLYQGSPVTSVSLSPDGATLVASDAIGRVILWSTATGHRVASLGFPGADSVTFSSAGKMLAAGRNRPRIRTVEPSQRPPRQRPDHPAKQYRAQPRRHNACGRLCDGDGQLVGHGYRYPHTYLA